MKQIYRKPSDLDGVPNGIWKMYVLDMLERGPVEADPTTGAAHSVGEYPHWYTDGVLYGGTDGHQLSADEIYQLQTGQLRTDDVLIPTEVIDPPRPAEQVSVVRREHAIPADVVLEARAEVLGQQAAWQKRATINLLDARRKKGRNLTAAEIHEITRRTR